MTLRYKVVQQAEPGVKGGGKYRYYLRAAGRELVTIDKLSDMLAQRTSLSSTDVKAVLWGLTDVIPNLLLNNYSVEIGELGIFSVSMKSDPAEKLDDATWRKIRGMKVNFRVGKKIQNEVKNASFEKISR